MLGNLTSSLFEINKMRRKVKVNLKNTVVKAKEKFISFFNKLCLWIGTQVFWYVIIEVLKQLLT